MEDHVPTFEFELRYAVRDHICTLKSLREMGAEFRCKLVQKDQYFSPPPLRTIERGSILRIREEAREDGTNRVMISFKTPNFKKMGVETREETEVEVLVDKERAAELLERLGAKPLVIVNKERMEYSLFYKGVDFTVTLDHVDALGHFVEIELVSDRKDDVEQLFTLGETLAKRLGIVLSNKISLGYHELMLDKKWANPHDPTSDEDAPGGVESAR